MAVYREGKKKEVQYSSRALLHSDIFWPWSFQLGRLWSSEVVIALEHIKFDYTLHQQRLEQVQSAKYLGITISDDSWIGVNTFQKFHLRQLRHWVFFGAIWPLHLGTLRKLHTKHWFVLSLSVQHLFGIPIMKIGQMENVQRTAARWTCRRWRNTSSVGDMLDKLE